MPYKDPEKQRQFQRERVARNRKKWIDANGPCVRCGSDERLEVDHVDPSGKTTHNVWSWSEERRLTELAKCQVLCHDCHQVKSTAEATAAMGGPMKHGSISMYGRGKCRCDDCRAASRVSKRNNRLRRQAEGLPYQ